MALLIGAIPQTAQDYNSTPSIFQSLFKAKSEKSTHPLRGLSRILTPSVATELTFEQIGQAIGRDEVWVAAAFYGQVRLPSSLFLFSTPSHVLCLQAKLTEEDIAKLSAVLGLDSASLKSEVGEDWFPHRGIGPAVPTDPVIYRLYEVSLGIHVQVRVNVGPVATVG